MTLSRAIRVFIGSSSESLKIAEGLKVKLESIAEVRIWDEALFAPGSYTLEALLAFIGEFDYAVFILGSDDVVSSRGSRQPAPRDNVIFEAGICYGALGRGRVFLCVPHGVKAPTDTLGLTTVGFQEPTDENWVAAMRSASVEIAREIIRRGVRRSLDGGESSSPEDWALTYENLEAARSDMVAACMSATYVRILANKGAVFFGTDESIISLAEANQYTSLKRLRIALLDPEAPWINKGLAKLRKYESAELLKRDLSNSHAIVHAAIGRFVAESSLDWAALHLHAEDPYFRMLLTDHEVFVSAYPEDPSVQARDLPVYRFVRHRTSLYWGFKRLSNNIWQNKSKPYHANSQDEQGVQTSAGGIVFGRSDNQLHVALVERENGGWVMPKGHKESTDANLKDTAIREVGEELGIPAEAIRVERQLDEYSYDEIGEDIGVRKVTFLFVMTVREGELPSLAPDADHRDAQWWSVADLPLMPYSYQRTLLAEAIEQLVGQEA